MGAFKTLQRSSWYISKISSPILLFLLILPLAILSYIACNFGSQKTLVSRETLGFLSLFWFDNWLDNQESRYSRDGNGGFDGSNTPVLKSSWQYELEKEGTPKDDFMSNQALPIKYNKFEKIESALSKARLSIKEAAKSNNKTFNTSLVGFQQDEENYIPYGPIYRNANAFYRSYMEMERVFKIYVYEEGEVPIFHNGPCRDIYTTEGRFIHEMERGNQYRTHNPEEAHVYFMPFSVAAMVQYVYEAGSPHMHPVRRIVADYVDTIAHKHPFWNRSLGANHFMLSCHDWGPYSTTQMPLLFNTSIRVLCNANTSEGFNPIKDASLPEINLKTGEITGLLGGSPPSQRSILAFFAGGLHGHIRHLLLDEWHEKDPDILVYEKTPPDGPSYESMLRNSKFCLCPSGYEVASPRIVEAIYTACVPVLISDGYIPPFNDVLNWKKFTVVLKVEDIPNIKTILMGISEKRYFKMQKRVKQVQRHFVMNGSPKRFDVFHMILHSIWLRRLNLRLHTSM